MSNMIVNAELFVKDLPGQLVGSLEPISLLDGNIVEVVHNRERIINHRICINVTFEMEDKEQLCRLKDVWGSKDIIISRLGSVYQTYSMEYMLIGNFDGGMIEDMMKEAGQTISLDATDIRYSSKAGTSVRRTAMIAAKTRSEEDLDMLDRFLDEKCKEADITYVRGV
ncbi:MAG: homoserine dehydrogenase [Candidatus Methanomethylophilaceae archaeon]|nr:homoserine dehydrogenase [Candidatus Methanomethylophilaceae archaeon]